MGKGKKRRDPMTTADARTLFGDAANDLVEQARRAAPDALIEAAEKALADFDYDQAHRLLRAALIRSGGEAGVACRLASFLVDEYAAFDEAVRILSSPLSETCPAGDRLLARALHLADRRPEALDALRRVNAADADAHSLREQAELERDLGRFADALQTIERAARAAAMDAGLSALKAECEAGESRAVAPQLAQADELLRSGRVSEARTLLDGLAARAWLPAEYYRIRKTLDAAAASARAEETAALAAAAEGRGDLAEALALWSRVAETDPAHPRAAARRTELERRLREQERTRALDQANALFLAGSPAEALPLYLKALHHLPEPTGVTPAAQPLVELAQQLSASSPKTPAAAQVNALLALLEARAGLEAGDGERFDAAAARIRNLLDGFPPWDALRRARREQQRRQAAERAVQWMAEAQAAERAGRLEDAASLYEKAAEADGFQDRAAAAARAAALREAQAREQQNASVRRYLESLVARGDHFTALAELARHADLVSRFPELAELERRARDGMRTLYPVSLTLFEPGAVTATDLYRSGGQGMEGFLPEQTRVAYGTGMERYLFLQAGRRLAAVDLRDLFVRSLAELPPQADLEGKRSFMLHDLTAEGSDALHFVGFEDDLLLGFSHKRGRVQVESALALSRGLQQTRAQVARWFAPNGRDEQIVVCQSSPGAGGGTRLYSFAARDGRQVLDESFGYALFNLRRAPATEPLYVIHRFPEPAQMRRRDFFSFALMDARLRLVERFTIRGDELDNALVESTRWMRFGAGGRMYFLFRCFEAYSGQLLPRPLAFVAMEKNGTLVYATADSATFLQKSGEMEGPGEIVESGGREVMVILCRRKDEPFLALIDLAGLKLVERVPVAAGEKVIAVARGSVPGTYVTVAVTEGRGEIVIRRGRMR